LQNQTVCTFNLENSSVRLPTKGGHVSINVTAAQNCDYAVKSNVNWIYVSSPDSLSGNGTISLRVTINPAVSRTGKVMIGGRELTITQSRN